MGELKNEINVFNESEESKEPQAGYINGAMKHFEFASTVWDQKFNGRGVTKTIDRFTWPGDEVMKYPNANNREAGGGVLVDGGYMSATAVDIDLAVKLIIREAKSEIDNIRINH